MVMVMVLERVRRLIRRSASSILTVPSALIGVAFETSHWNLAEAQTYSKGPWKRPAMDPWDRLALGPEKDHLMMMWKSLKTRRTE